MPSFWAAFFILHLTCTFLSSAGTAKNGMLFLEVM